MRDILETYLTTNLYNYLQQNLDRIYRKSLCYVRKKTQETITFPEQCPYLLDDLLSELRS
ncbi:MAG: DUF29 family protein [Crocosphaera sp.]